MNAPAGPWLFFLGAERTFQNRDERLHSPTSHRILVIGIALVIFMPISGAAQVLPSLHEILHAYLENDADGEAAIERVARLAYAYFNQLAESNRYGRLN
jgi:hypothetical protein